MTENTNAALANGSDNTTPADAKKRESVATRAYVDGSGKDHKSPSAETTKLRLTFKGGTVREFSPANYPDPIKTALIWHGLSQKMGDTWAGAKGDIDVAIENADSMDEQLRNGTWTERAEGVGPQPTLVAEAVWRALVASSTDGGKTTPDGRPLDDARKATTIELCKDKATREGALKDDKIAAEYEAIKAERAAARAKDAADKAKDKTIGDAASKF